MRIGIIGINHKQADLKLREILAKVCQKRFGPGNSAHPDHAFILLSTCNRTEIYFSSDDLSESHSYLLNVLKQEISEEFDQKLYSYFSNECFLHLVSVTAGLDSAIVAETEIQKQVKHAYEAALGYTRLPPALHYLFQKSLKIAKSIRSKYALGRGMPDLEHAIFQTGAHLFKTPKEKSILFIGASDINEKILHFFKRKGCPQITLCNRSMNHAQEISLRYQISTMPWESLNDWTDFDWIILGTKAPEFIVTPEQLQMNFPGKKLMIDLSLPRNADPKIAKDPRIQLLNIDQINRMLKFRRRWLNESITQAQEEIEKAVERYIALFHEKDKRALSFVA